MTELADARARPARRAEWLAPSLRPSTSGGRSVPSLVSRPAISSVVRIGAPRPAPAVPPWSAFPGAARPAVAGNAARRAACPLRTAALPGAAG